MHKTSLFLVIFLLFMGILIVNPFSSHGTGESKTQNILSDTFWVVNNWNNDISINWFSAGLYLNNENNSLVRYKILSENPTNYSYPNAGKLSIGNFTDFDTDNNDIASTLTLSIWPWLPGIVTHVNWTHHELEAESASNSIFLQGNLTITNEISFEIGNLMRSAIKFDYKQNLSLGNQNTTLIYDKSTGVLLSGYSEINFGQPFIIGLKYHNSTLISPTNSSNISGSSNVRFETFLPLIFVLILLSSFRKKIKY